jgi:hypothetical protein
VIDHHEDNRERAEEIDAKVAIRCVHASSLSFLDEGRKGRKGKNLFAIPALQTFLPSKKRAEARSF